MGSTVLPPNRLRWPEADRLAAQPLGRWAGDSPIGKESWYEVTRPGVSSDTGYALEQLPVPRAAIVRAHPDADCGKRGEGTGAIPNPLVELATVQLSPHALGRFL